MTATQAPAPPTPAVAEPAGNDGFGRILRAEWTKFHTVRGWVIGMIVAPLLTGALVQQTGTFASAFIFVAALPIVFGLLLVVACRPDRL